MPAAAVLVPGPFALGEGPLWHGGRIWWIDILAPAVHACGLDGGGFATWPMPSPVGCLVPARGGGFLVGLADGVHAWRPGAAPVRVAAHAVPGHRLNDGKPSPEGLLLVGGMALDERPGASHLFRLDGDRLTPLLAGITISNGLAWSLDGGTCYYIDSGTGRVDALAWGDGTLHNRRPVWAPERGTPDGMAIDAEGLLWVALWDGGAVVRVDPHRGVAVTTVPLPCRRPTSCAFVGPGLDRLVVTSARTGLADPGPGDGALWLLDPGVAGAPVPMAAWP
jgi:sugar lactone lactonase YvrE